MTNIDLKNLGYSAPDKRVTSFEVLKLIIQIFVAHALFTGSWLKFFFLDIDMEEFNQIFDLMPELKTQMLVGRIQAQLVFLFHISNVGPRLNQAQTENLNTIIRTWDSEQKLKNYFENETLSPLVMLSSWCEIAYQDTLFVLQKTQLSVSILDNFTKMKQISSKMDKTHSDLLLGNTSKSEALELANNLSQIREIVFGFINEYFCLPLRTQDLVKFLESIFTDYIELETVSVAEMRAYKLSNTLHLNQQLNSLDDIFSWSEAGVISGKIDNYIMKINKSNIDPIIVAQTKLKQRKQESVAIIAKVNEIDEIIEDDENTSFKIDLIVSDLSLLQKQLQDINDVGIAWDPENFGISQIQISNFREKLQKRKTQFLKS